MNSERLVRSALLYAIAAEVLGDEAAAARWLTSPQTAPEGARPLELAQTEAEFWAVETLLGRMEHGVFT